MRRSVPKGDVMGDDNSTSEKALDLLVYGPLGLALYVRDTVPTFARVFVSRGRSEVASRRRKVNEQVNDKVANARSIGEFAVTVGAPKVKEKVEESLRTARSLAEQAFTGLVVPADGTPAAPGEEPAARPAPVATRAPRPDREERRAAAASLAIPDYDELSASQVVERLDGLGAHELAAVREYEESHRGRRTILFKIDQLTA
ncbi:MAG TPA: hypothetical protein VF152_09455 [Acidimicrobiia bacterium]